MKYFRKVRSSLKGTCDVELGPKTVIIGPNGAGKSTIVQALELATRGFVSDVEGRDQVKQNQALARLFDDPRSMFSKAELADTAGESYVFSWEMREMKPGSYKKPATEQPVGVQFVIQDLMGTLGGSEATVGAWLEKQVIGEMTPEKVLSALPPAHRKEAKLFVNRQSNLDLMHLSKAAADEARRLRTGATKAEGTVAKLTEGIAPPLLDEQLVALEKELAECTTSNGSITSAVFEQKGLELGALKRKLEGLRTSLAELPSVPSKAESALNRIKTAKTLIAGHIGAFGEDSSMCWVCGHDEEGAIERQIDSLNDIQAHLNEFERVTRSRLNLQMSIGQVEQQITGLSNYLDHVPVSDEDKSGRARELMHQISSDRAARQSWRNAEAVRLEVAQKRAQGDKLALLSKEFKKAGRLLLERSKSSFEARVTSFLPKGETFRVDLASARMGLLRNGQFHSALSGAEESRVLLALASAQAKTNGVAVLIPKDRGWDPVTLANVMQVLQDAPYQVIIMSTVAPESTVGEWTVVNV